MLTVLIILYSAFVLSVPSVKSSTAQHFFPRSFIRGQDNLGFVNYLNKLHIKSKNKIKVATHQDLSPILRANNFVFTETLFLDEYSCAPFSTSPDIVYIPTKIDFMAYDFQRLVSKCPILESYILDTKFFSHIILIKRTL
jgi:hypothetical protein